MDWYCSDLADHFSMEMDAQIISDLLISSVKIDWYNGGLMKSKQFNFDTTVESKIIKA